MPDNSIKIPVTLPNRTNYNESPNFGGMYYYDPVYDQGFKRGMNREAVRSDNQTWYQHVGNGFVSRAASIAPKLIGGLGSVGYALAAPFSDEISYKNIWDNPILNWSDQLDESLKENFPVFKSREYQEGGLLAKLGTTSFWASDAFDGLAYAASAFVQGAVISKVVQGVGALMKSAEVGSKVLRGLGMIGSEQSLTLGLATSYNTVAEAAVEAHQTQKELEELYRIQFPDMSEEEIKAKASEGARDSFIINSLALFIPNYVQNKFFHGTKDLRNEVFKDVVQNKESAKAIDSIWRQMGSGVVSEGLEENVQTAIQQYERNMALGNTNAGILDGVGRGMYDNVKGLVKSFTGFETSDDETEGALSIFLGGLLGAGFGAMGYARDLKSYESAKGEAKEKYDKFFKDIAPAALRSMIDSSSAVFASDGNTEIDVNGTKLQIPKYVLDQNGKPVIDRDAVTNLGLRMFRDKTNWDASTVATLNNSDVLDTFTKEMALAQYAYELATKPNYTLEDINLLLDNYAKTGLNEAAQEKVDTLILQNTETIKSYLQEIKKFAESNLSSSDNLLDQKFSNFITKAQVYTQARKNAVEKLRTLNLSDSNKAAIDSIQQENDSYIADLINDRENLKKEYEARVYNPEQLVMEYNALNSEKSLSPEKQERKQELSYILNEQIFSNGSYVLNNTGSRNLPVFTNIKKALKTELSYEDRLAQEEANTMIAEMDYLSSSSPVAIKALNFIRKSSLANRQRSSIASRISDDVTSELNNVSARLEEVQDTISILQGVMPDMTLEENEIAELFPNLDPETEVTDDFINQQIRPLERSLSQELPTLLEEGKVLSIVSQELPGKRDPNYDKFIASKDKETTLQDIFQDEFVTKPFKAFEQRFNKNTETITDISTAQELFTRTKQARVINSKRNKSTKDLDKIIEQLEKTVIPKILKNLSSSDEIQLAVNDLQTEFFLSFLKEEAQLGDDFTSYETLLNKLLKQEGLKEEVQKKHNDLIDEFFKLEVVEKSKFFKSYANNSNRYDYSSLVVEQILEDLYGNDANVKKYLSNRDFVGLQLALRGDTSDAAENIQKIAYMIEALRAYKKLIKFTTSKLEVADYMGRLSQIQGIKPSLQQLIVLLDLALFSTSKSGVKNFDNWALVMGIGGSGKTHLVGKLIPSLINNDKFIAFSRSEKASANVNEALGRTTYTFENFLNDNLDNIEYIILDEAFTFSNQQLSDISVKLKEVQNKTGKLIKVIALGDPSQVSAENGWFTSVQRGEVTITSPLVFSYRNNVSSLSSFTDSYKLNTAKVENNTAISNQTESEFLANPQDHLGVISLGEESILQAFQNSPVKSKVFIVANETQKQHLKNAINSPDILTVQEAQGYQWDQVFTDLVEAYLPQDSFEANKYYYTAFSRARKSLVISGTPINNSVSQIELTDLSTSKNEQWFKENLEIFNSQVGSTVQDTLVPQEIFTDPNIEEMQYAEYTEEEITIEPEEGFRLSYPTNYNLASTFDTGGEVVSAIDKSTAYVIKTVTGNSIKYFVVARHSTLPDRFLSLGMLSDLDFQRSIKLQNLLDVKVSGVSANLVSNNAAFTLTPQAFNSALVGSFPIKKVSPIKVKYDINSNESLENTIVKFYETFFGTDELGNKRYPAEVYDVNGVPVNFDKEWVIDGKVNWKALRDKVSIFIPDKKEATADKLLPGIPYLKIANPYQKGADLNSSVKAFFIRLEPSRLTEDHRYIVAIKSLYDSIQKIESATDLRFGTEEFSNFIREYANNYEVDYNKEIDNTGIYAIKLKSDVTLDSPLDKEYQNVVERIFAGERKIVTFKTEQEAKDYMQARASGDFFTDSKGATYTFSSIQPMGKLFVIEYYSGAGNDSSETAIFRDYSVRSGKGDAQKAINSIATANKYIGDQLIRSKTTKLARSKSLLSTKYFTDFQALSKDPVAIESGWKFKPEPELSEDDPRTFTELVDFFENYLGSRSEAIKLMDKYTVPPYDLEMLSLFVGFDAFSAGRHKFLRTPLQTRRADKKGINQLGSNIEANLETLNELMYSKFVQVERTIVEVDLGETKIEEPKDKMKLTEVLSKIPSTKLEHLDRVRSLLQSFGVDATVIFGKEENVTRSYRNSKGEVHVEIITNISLKDIENGNLNAIQVFLHEAIHAATLPAITQGKKDLVEGKDTKAATFVKRIQALQKRFNSVIATRKLKRVDIYQATSSKLNEAEFIANLSNPVFYAQASTIDAISKKSKSLISDIIRAILDFFGLQQSNIYELMVKSLEDLYSSISTSPAVQQEVKTEDIDIDKYKSAVLTELEDLDDESIQIFLEDNTINKYLQYKGKKWSFKPSIDKVSLEEQVKTLRTLYEILTGEKLAFAYYVPTPNVFSAVPGSVISTRYSDLNIALETSYQRNLAESYIRNSLITGKTLEELLALEADEYKDQFFTDVEKQLFQSKPVQYYEDSAIVREYLFDNLNKSKDYLTGLKDLGPVLYKEAKELVLSVVRENLNTRDSGTKLYKTKADVYKEILQLAETSTAITIEGQIARVRKEINKAKKSGGDTLELVSQLKDLELQVRPYRILRSYNPRTLRKFLYDILEDIYPKSAIKSLEDLNVNLELFELVEDGYLTDDRLDSELTDLAGISEHIKNYDKSNELTLSDTMKDFLSNIRVGNRFLHPGLAYLKTVRLAMSLDWNRGIQGDKRSLINQLNTQEDLSEVDNAVRENLKSILIYSVTNNYGDFTLPDNLSIISRLDSAGKMVYAGVYHIDGNNNRILSELTDKDVISSYFDNSEQLFDWLNSQSVIRDRKNLSIREFNGMLAKTEAANAVRGVANVMASMRETDLYVALRSSVNGRKFKHIRSKSSSYTTTLAEDVKMALRNLDSDNKLGSFIKKWLSELSKTKSGPESTKVTVIKNFLKDLGDFPEDIFISASKAPDYFVQIENFLSHANEFNYKGVETEEGADRTVEDMIDDSSSFVNSIAKILSSSAEYFRNPSVRTGKNKKYYTIHESSHGFDTLLALIDVDVNNPIFKGTVGSNSNRMVPEHLTSEFYKDYNLYSLGLNKLHNIGEYDAAVNEDNGSVTPYLRENRYFFTHRKFSQGFLQAASQFNGSKYHQYAYIPGDKPKAVLVETNILSFDEALKGLELIYKQLLYKKDSELNIGHYNDSRKNDFFRNATIIKQALDSLKVPFNEESMPLVTKEALRLLKEEGKKQVDKLVKLRLPFELNTYSTFNKLRSKTGSKLDIPLYKDQPKNFYIDYEQSSIPYEFITPMMELFVVNNYVNGYFLNQLYTGDYLAYKKSSTEILKRNTSDFGPGMKALIDEEIGMRKTFRMLVLDDEIENKGVTRETIKRLVGDITDEEFERLLSFFSDNYDITDAQGFMTPARKSQLERGFELSWKTGDVHKPLYSGVDLMQDQSGRNIPIKRLVKYSSINLSDRMVSQPGFEILKRFRTALEKLGIDEVVFRSAFKLGAPVNPNGFSLKFDEFINAVESDNISQIESLVVTLNNSSYRLQHNPQTSVNKDVSIFTQLQYFLNVYETSQEEASTVYQAVSELIKMGREEFDKKIDTSEKLKSFLAKKFKGPGSEKALDLLVSGLSLNQPLLTSKSIIALASGIEADTVSLSFKGSKLVLQSSIGTRYDNRELSLITEEVNGENLMFAEAIVPRELLTPEQVQALKTGKSVYMFGDMMGFRIPSTELHSAVPLKIVGTYSSAIQNPNVVIVPKEIVTIHGSDQTRFDFTVM